MEKIDRKWRHTPGVPPVGRSKVGRKNFFNMSKKQHIDPIFRTRAFLKELKKTGVSEAFLTAAASSIEEAFRHVPEEALSVLLENIRETAVRQAETERALDQAAQHLDALETTQKRLFTRLQHSSSSLNNAKSSLTSAVLMLYAAASGHTDPLTET
jgi:hypothetical protein